MVSSGHGDFRASDWTSENLSLLISSLKKSQASAEISIDVTLAPVLSKDLVSVPGPGPISRTWDSWLSPIFFDASIDALIGSSLMRKC